MPSGQRRGMPSGKRRERDAEREAERDAAARVSGEVPSVALLGPILEEADCNLAKVDFLASADVVYVPRPAIADGDVG